MIYHLYYEIYCGDSDGGSWCFVHETYESLSKAKEFRKYMDGYYGKYRNVSPILIEYVEPRVTMLKGKNNKVVVRDSKGKIVGKQG
jgi:hypothetical protein